MRRGLSDLNHAVPRDALRTLRQRSAAVAHRALLARASQTGDSVCISSCQRWTTCNRGHIQQCPRKHSSTPAGQGDADKAAAAALNGTSHSGKRSPSFLRWARATLSDGRHISLLS